MLIFLKQVEKNLRIGWDNLTSFNTTELVSIHFSKRVTMSWNKADHSFVSRYCLLWGNPSNNKNCTEANDIVIEENDSKDSRDMTWDTMPRPRLKVTIFREYMVFALAFCTTQICYRWLKIKVWLRLTGTKTPVEWGQNGPSGTPNIQQDTVFQRDFAKISPKSVLCVDFVGKNKWDCVICWSRTGLWSVSREDANLIQRRDFLNSQLPFQIFCVSAFCLVTEIFSVCA